MGFRTNNIFKKKIDSIKKDFEETEKRLEERIGRLEKSLEEAEKPKLNEPVENKLKDEVEGLKKEVKK